jgi:hypothetical protein
MAKAKKKRASKYEKPLKIHGSFDEVIKLSATPDEKKEEVKKDKKKNK